ncbi:MAG: hypothetical protein JWN56_1986 [Sphingobacteriales bacterium]|nr:hypothetical protein [Sphingobacteriales bacterium]
MKTLIRIAVTIVISFYSAGFFKASAQMKVPKKTFIGLLNQGKYDEVYLQAKKLRGSIYGKNALLDYFIAKSLCLDGYKEKSEEEFQKIFKNYRLSANQKQFLNKEIDNCFSPSVTTTSTLTSASFNYLNDARLPQGGVSGKMGYVITDCFKPDQYADFSNAKSDDELNERLFGLNQAAAARKKLDSILPDDYEVKNAGRFMVVTLNQKSISDSRVDQLTQRLERVFQFYVSYYNLRYPDKLLTVYLLPSSLELRKVANIVHGIKLPANSLGYSCLADLSLLGISTPEQLLTLYHEIFHLIVRTDVGDIPAWLDEGLASLYSTSHWENGVLISDKVIWRTDILLRASRQRIESVHVPTIKSMINYSWDSFDGVKADYKNICQASVNYSLANHFLIYLQKKDKLKQVINAYKNRPEVDLAAKVEPADNLKIFEDTMGEKISVTELAFKDWIQIEYGIYLSSASY